MAHRLLEEEIIEPKIHWVKQWIAKIPKPNLEGKIGISLYLGKKEVFIGISVGDVEMEKIIRRRKVAVPKGKVKVFRFD